MARQLMFLSLLALGTVLGVAPATHAESFGNKAGMVAAITGPGELTIDNEKAGRTRIAKVNEVVFENDKIMTHEGQTVSLALNEGSEVMIAPGSQFVINTFKGGRTQISVFTLFYGMVRAYVKKVYNSQEVFAIKTATSVMGVRGTIFLVEVERGGTQTTLHTLQGTVAIAASLSDLNNPALSVLVSAGKMSGMRAGMRKADPPSPFDRAMLREKLERSAPEFSRRLMSGHSGAPNPPPTREAKGQRLEPLITGQIKEEQKPKDPPLAKAEANSQNKQFAAEPSQPGGMSATQGEQNGPAGEGQNQMMSGPSGSAKRTLQSALEARDRGSASQSTESRRGSILGRGAGSSEGSSFTQQHASRRDRPSGDTADDDTGELAVSGSRAITANKLNSRSQKVFKQSAQLGQRPTGPTPVGPRPRSNSGGVQAYSPNRSLSGRPPMAPKPQKHVAPITTAPTSAGSLHLGNRK